MLRKCKLIEITREEAEQMRARIQAMGHPTLSEMTDPTKTVYDLVWLRRVGQNYRIERTK